MILVMMLLNELGYKLGVNYSQWICQIWSQFEYWLQCRLDAEISVDDKTGRVDNVGVYIDVGSEVGSGDGEGV